MKASVAKGKGKYGNAMEFKGGDNHVLIKSSKSLSIADEVTISAWVNWNDAPGNGWLCVMANGSQGGPWENYGLFVNRGSRYFYFTLSVGGEGAHKVMNSGNDDAHTLRNAERVSDFPDNSLNVVGFRCAKDAP